MKTKRITVGVLIAALVLAFIPIYMEAYYIAVALIVGVLVMGHRELWSLLTKGKLPPFDDRVRANVGQSIRNAFVFFAVAIVSLMLLFSVNPDLGPETLDILGGSSWRWGWSTSSPTSTTTAPSPNWGKGG